MGHPGIRMQLVLLTVMGIVARPVIDLMPGYAGQVFNMGADGLATLLAAYGIGATIAGVFIASRSSGVDGMSRLSILSVLFVSLILMLFAATNIFWLGVGAAVLLGFALLVFTVTSQTLIQSSVDPDFRGRVISVHGLVMMGIPALGAMALGGLADQVGLRSPVMAGAAVFFCFWALAWRRRASLAVSLETVPAAEAAG
jgi:predicted MFS family arabinose efflux permease